jgi:ERCC4-type nuclease
MCRLYSQAEAMCKHYRTPVLLIEFDGDKPFMLQVIYFHAALAWSLSC